MNSPRSDTSSSSSVQSPNSRVPKRGRPKAETLPEKIKEGEEGEGNFKCSVCRRLFPRNKSLIAHERTHTDERPYVCDYPSCERAFRQSGQLKTHQRRHTGEKTFACQFPGCSERFIHSNRRCRTHPHHSLVRDGKEEICVDFQTLSPEEVFWLERYVAEKENPAKRRRVSSETSSDTCDMDPEIVSLIKTESNRVLNEDELVAVYTLATMHSYS